MKDDVQKLTIDDPKLYLQTGQYLAVGFRGSSARPFLVRGGDSYYIDITTADGAEISGEPISFIRQAVYRLTFMFKIKPEIGLYKMLRTVQFEPIYISRTTFTFQVSCESFTYGHCSLIIPIWHFVCVRGLKCVDSHLARIMITFFSIIYHFVV